MSLTLSVVLPTHNPHRGRLARTLAGLRAQTMPVAHWETLVIDNASTPALDAAELAALGPANLRVVRESSLGLTPARRRGFAEARGEILVLVDDDNVLAPDYLDQVVALFAAHPKLGAAGGKNLGEFESPRPAWWQPEFDGLLACRDLGDKPQICPALFDPSTGRNEYPLCAPVGAGMALRRTAIGAWLADDSSARLPDRRGNELSSSGDNDIVLSILRAGWSVGYFPALVLTHLIPSGRVQPDYIARLNRGIARSWVQVLHKHDANPWPPVAPWTVPLRKLKAWFVYRAWSGDLARIRWQGACGHFEGLAQLR
jgi:glycosyltransferase involved in cell wall biosynthesis